MGMLEAKAGEFDQAAGGAVEHGGKRAVGVWEILCWAFQRECVSLDLGEELTGLSSKVNVDPIQKMVEIAALGCRVEGGGSSQSHHDADLVAATLAVLPKEMGGFRAATWVAELARAGSAPYWRTRREVVPVDMKRNQHGFYAKVVDANLVEDCGWNLTYLSGKKRTSKRRADYCQCVIRPSDAEIGRMQRQYLAWYGILLQVRSALQITHLTAHVVTDRMPPRTPWKKVA
jgi:hypothetical protein